MKCNECNNRGTIYRLVNGDTSLYLCTLCLSEALLDLVTTNNVVILARNNRNVAVLDRSYLNIKKDSIGE